MLRIPQTEYVNNEYISSKIRITKKGILTIRRRRLKFIAPIMKKRGSENFLRDILKAREKGETASNPLKL